MAPRRGSWSSAASNSRNGTGAACAAGRPTSIRSTSGANAPMRCGGAARPGPPRRDAHASDDDLRAVVRARVFDDFRRGVAAREDGGPARRTPARASPCAESARARLREAAAARASRRRRPSSRRRAASRGARRCARRRRRPAPGPMQQSSESSVFHTRSIAWSDRYACTSSSTRSAVRRSASSRSAIRLPLRKKLLAARSICSGRYTLPAASRASRSSADTSTITTSSACVEDRVGHGLPDVDARDAADDVVQALDVLHVERREHVDARGKQLVDVLPALRVPRARHVRVREFVDQDQRRVARQRRIEVELLQRAVLVRDLRARQDRKLLRAALRSPCARASRATRRRRPCPRAAAGVPRSASRTSCRRRPTRRSRCGGGRGARTPPAPSLRPAVGRDRGGCRSSPDSIAYAHPNAQPDGARGACAAAIACLRDAREQPPGHRDRATSPRGRARGSARPRSRAARPAARTCGLRCAGPRAPAPTRPGARASSRRAPADTRPPRR